MIAANFVLGISFCGITLISAAAQEPQPPAPATPLASTPDQPTPAIPPADKRMFGVLPNYRTVDATGPVDPIPPREKFHIALKDSFDFPGYAMGAVFAALYQATDSNPSFGQGMKGYAHRYVTAYADQVIGNMLKEAILPSLLREDPRYFRLGQGTKRHRFGYSASRIFVTRTDASKSRFNTSEVLGSGITAAIATSYYPDSRTVADTTQRMSIQLGIDALSNVLKEFWPDLSKRLRRK